VIVLTAVLIVLAMAVILYGAIYQARAARELAATMQEIARLNRERNR
jgi:hypothetical protein